MKNWLTKSIKVMRQKMAFDNFNIIDLWIAIIAVIAILISVVFLTELLFHN